MIYDFRLWLLFVEQDLKPAEYDALFDKELERLLRRISDPAEQNRLREMSGARWTNYVAAALRNAGFGDQCGLQEKIHDVVVKLLVVPGGLFRDYDETRHGPFDLRWKRSVSNAVKNVAEKERNRRRFIPTVSIGQEFRPGGVTDLPDRTTVGRRDDERLVDDFRQLVRQEIGELGVGVLDGFLQGIERKALVGNPDLGRPGKFVIKRIVQEIKSLAVEFARRRGDPAFLRDIERAMERESDTIRKQLRSTAARQVG